jgi:hypothetical protein
MTDILPSAPSFVVLNMDETSSKLIDHHVGTVGDTGAERISCLFDHDEETSVAAFPTINAAGETFSPWTVAKGKTSGCETRYRPECIRAIKEGPLILAHQESGWTNHEIARA